MRHRPPTRGSAATAEKLIARLRSRSASVAVIGLGYVGLPLACEFSLGGFKVQGIDVDPGRVAEIGRGHSHVPDVSARRLSSALSGGRLRATSDFAVLDGVDAVIICVPTPLRKTRDPDISYIVSALDAALPHLHAGTVLVLESTTYPGTTEEIILPKVESKGLRAGLDVFLAFSPERVDPGNTRFGLRNTPKIVGGITDNCGRVAQALYEQVIDQVICVSSTRSAEMVKLLENTFRSVNIALVNEMAVMCDRLGLNVWEVIDAAASKPFGFMPFYPGPGLGGHCIPIDPHYLSWKLKTLNYHAKFIELAAEINGSMPQHVVARIVEALNEQRKSVRGARILIMGVAYKKDVGDVRESPALDIIKLLADRGADIRYNDPHAGEITVDGGHVYRSVRLAEETLRKEDLVVIVTDHSSYDYEFVVANSRCVVDTRNATRHVRSGREKIRRL
ncbi:MAG: nucleotide sugar dehydrogenase [Acidobacteria bacterium]|nr:nucleotide sugar dehydrogenase [Acidobacteriota bacterium]